MKEFFRRFGRGFLRNLKTIIQALIFSVIIWFFISIQIFPDVSMHIEGVDVACAATPFMNEENLIITKVNVDKVTIQIEGKRYSINELNADNFKAKCDMSKVFDAGTHTVPIEVEVLNDIECKVTSTDLTAEVTVIKMISREIKVIPNTSEINIASEMQIEGDVTVYPDFVTVTGEERYINSIDHAEAFADGGGELDHSADIPAHIVCFTSSGREVSTDMYTADTDDFTVSVPVYKLKTLPVQVKFTGTSGTWGFHAEELEYMMARKEIAIASPDSSIDNLDVFDIGGISLSKLTLKDLQGGVQLPVELPEGYKNISGNKYITVTFPQADDFGQLGFTVPADNFTMINVPSAYSVKLLTNEITVSVVGYSDYIQEMTPSDMYATINLLGMELSEGTKSLSVTFRIKGANVRAWVSGEEYKVELLITNAEDTDA